MARRWGARRACRDAGRRRDELARARRPPRDIMDARSTVSDAAPGCKWVTNTWDPIKRSLSSHPPAPPPKAPPSDGAVADAIASLPGLGVAFAVSQGGFAVADHISTAVGTPVAGVPLAILLGAAINNAVTLPRWVRPGLRTASGTVLRIGIVCVGAKLSASDLLESGTFALVPVLISVGAGLYLIPKIAKSAGLHPRLGSLLAAGTSICGVTAVSALAPAIAATQAEVSVAVANVVVWGSCAMLAAPHLAHSLLGKCSEAAGMWLGLAVHDTAQVMGAGLTYTQAYDDERAFKSATVTKLMRNMALRSPFPHWQPLTLRKDLLSKDPPG